MLKTLSRVFAVIAATLVLAACVASAPHHHASLYHDASNPLKRVAVLPMKNDTSDVGGADAVRKKMFDALDGKSYRVKDFKETDQILRDQMGITLGGQLEMTTPQKLGETLGVEGVLYGTLMDFDETTTGFVNIRKVRARFRLVNTATGQIVWERGLGVRSETRMPGRSGTAATVLTRAADARDKEVPWVTLESTATNESSVKQAFAVGIGVKLLTKAVGIHLDYESKELVRRVTETLPWGPGSDAPAEAPFPVRTYRVASSPAMKKMKSSPAPSFGYMDYGKRDFSALLVSVSVDKNGRGGSNLEIPLAKAGDNIRMDIDLSRTMKANEGTPPAFSRMSMVHRGDKKLSYTLYPDSQKYLKNADTGDNQEAWEKPVIEKTRIGSEVIDNHTTDKYKVKVTYKDGKVQEGFMWYAHDLDDMTVRTEIENNDMRVTTELKNIVLKTPPGSLFEIPQGYTEAQSFMDIMTVPKQ